MDAKELRRLKPELESFLDRYARLFGRPEAQGHARRFVHGLLLGGDRRSVENIAEAIEGASSARSSSSSPPPRGTRPPYSPTSAGRWRPSGATRTPS
jgi:hypothetical protein